MRTQNKITITCAKCGKASQRYPSAVRGKKCYCSELCRRADIKAGNGKYCSKECFYRKPAWNRGLKGVYDGDKSSHWKGGHPDCIKCGKKLSQRKPKYLYCKKCIGSCQEAMKKLSTSHRKPLGTHKKQKYDREMRNTALFKDWRKSVFERDDYTCQMCNKKNTYLHPHHIFSFTDFPEVRFIQSNGITLCKSCHYLVHRKDTQLAENGWYIRL